MTRFGWLILAMLCQASLVPAGNSAEQQNTATDAPGVAASVALEVQVIARKKDWYSFVSGLKNDDFELYDDGKRRELTYVNQEELPLSIILLVDAGASMKLTFKPLLEHMESAILALGPSDELSIITFRETADVALPFSKDKQLIRDSLGKLRDSLTPHGKVDAARVMEQASAQMGTASRGNRRRIIVAVTDNSSRDKSDASKEAPSDPMPRGVTVHGLIVPAISQHPDRYQPQSVQLNLKGNFTNYIEKTGGLAMGIVSAEAGARLGGLFDCLRRRYLVKYSSPSQNVTAARLKLKVTPEVEKREGKISVTARVAYIEKKTQGDSR